jgi:hypothetical protein
MPINYIPNDPRAGNPATVVIAPHAGRAAGRADFVFSESVPENPYNVGTDEFLFWQCREAALRAIDLWEEISGEPLTRWQAGQTIALVQRVPNDSRLNAFYNRASLSFFRVDGGGQSYQTGTSTDVVAHEAGHAFLDTIRPDLWGSMFGELGGFHEAFGDCIAILTALEDKATRQALLAGDLLRKRNFVETFGEDLAHGIKALIGANHNAAAPRLALNDIKWVLPSTLPTDGAPGVLINEVHSLGMIFSGCFYDTLTNIFAAGANKTEVGLLDASRTAGRILVAGTRTAPLQSRFYKAVGNAMLLGDQNLHGGANDNAIRAAFARHDIVLDEQQMLAPSNMLAGRAPGPNVVAVADVITRASRRDLVRMVGAAVQQRFFATQYELGSEKVAAVRHQHKVPLGDVSERLEGVVCLAEEDVLIGEAGGHAATLGVVPSVGSSVAEVQNFVYSLEMAGQIEGSPKEAPDATHAVIKFGEERRLVRTRFACGCRGQCRPSEPAAGPTQTMRCA